MKKTILLVLVALLALSACTTKVIMPEDAERYYTLQVQGNNEFEAAPDVAKVSLSVKTLLPDPQSAQAENSRLANAVHDALISAGVRKNEIETTGYRLYKKTHWDRETEKEVVDGYEASNTVVITTKDLDQVGKFIDAAVRAGANSVESINFELSEQKQSQVKTEALRRAAENAREKAVALAQGAQVSLGKVRSISEGYFNVVPMRAGGYAMAEVAMDGAMKAPTPILPQSVTVSAQVTVVYEVV